MINWIEIPLIRLLLAFMLGIALACHTKFHFYLEIPLLIFGFFVFLYFHQSAISYKNRWIGGALMYVCLFVFGHQLTHHHNAINKAGHYKNFIQKENTFLAHIGEMPSTKKSTKLVLKLQAIQVDDVWESTHGKLLAYAEADSISKSLAYGDQVVVHSNIRQIESSKNPHAFDAKQFYQFQNIHFQTFIKSEHLTPTGEIAGNPILKTAFTLRKKFLRSLENYLSKPNELAVGEALILGYKDNLSDDVKEAYSRTGAMHVLAVSGLHVSIVIGIITLLISFFNIKNKRIKKLIVLLQLLCIWGFAFVTGASPSVLRAATMFSFLVVGKAWNRNANIYNILAASAFFLLLINPYALMQIGFQLSYLAVLSIAYFQPKIEKWFYFENKILAYFWSLSAVSLAAQIGTMPISLYYFHQFPIYFLLSGLLVVPAAGVILSLGLLLFLLDLTMPFLANIVALVLDKILWGVNLLIFRLQDFPHSVIEGIWIGFGAVLLLYLAIALTSVWLQTKHFKWFNYGLVTLLLFAFVQGKRTFDLSNQQSMVIYDVSRNSLIEFYEGTQIKVYKNKQLDDKRLGFSAQNHRIFKGVSPSSSVEPIILSEQNQTIQFGEQSILVLQEEDTAIKQSDYILVRNNPILDLTPVLENAQVKQVIFDSSNSPKKIEKWVECCQNKGIAYHVTSSAGAFELKF